MNRIIQITGSAILLAAVISISSCTKDKTARAIITVLHDEVVLNAADTTYDTVAAPVVGAQVRMWFDGGNIDETVETNSVGQAEFSFENPVILEMSVTYLTQQVNRANIILSEGEVFEAEINIDHP